METNVRVIKANPFINQRTNDSTALVRVAAYARVSTNFDEQEDSFERQVEHYTNYIQANPSWKMVKVYSDPGISGTRAEKRPGFQEMINDCKEGKIDRILVKSIARFARNTVDALNYIRELKELGISIFFETQKIDTSTPGGDILITILAATAEEESRTISKNVKWSYTKKFEKGDFTFNYSCFLGYTRDKDGKVVIVDDEAKVVQRIYREYLYGHSISEIYKELTADGIKTPAGKTQWRYGVVRSILTNEKYYGTAIMQKTFKPDVLSKKRLKNEGQVDKFMAENKLPPIITKEQFDMVQLEMKQRDENRRVENKTRGNNGSNYCFSRMIRCGSCGSFYTRCNNLRVDGKKVPSWWCIAHRKDPKSCLHKGISEKAIEHAFVKALKELVNDFDEIKDTLKKSISSVLLEDTTEEVNKIENKINELQNEMLELHKKKTTGYIDSNEYARKGSKIAELIDEQKQKLEEIRTNNASYSLTLKRIEEINNALDEIKATEEFDEFLFKRLVQTITINDRYKITFKFKVGIEKTIISDEK